MIFEEYIARLAIALLGLAGFLVARHIHEEKKAARPLICPIKFDCDTVVNSDYSKFFGVPVEIFGMVYYALLGLSYLVLAFLPEVLPLLFVGFMVLVSISAFVFSVYLILVQLLILKKWCSWCIVSAFICTLVVIITLLAYEFSGLLGPMFS